MTTIAVVAAFGPNQPVIGVPFFLVTTDGHQLLADVTNNDGYMAWNNVPLPFVGTVRGAAGIIQFYEQPISINANNVSVRIGDRNNPAPQDILLPAPVPFKKPAPVPIPRGPLPAFDPDAFDPNTGASLPVHKTLNGVIPPFSDDSYMRANLWGVTDPDAPAIPGGGQGAARARLLTYLLHQYDSAWQARWLKTYGQRGYRQFWLSMPDALDGWLDVSQYVDLTKRVRDAGLIPCHFLRSKDHPAGQRDPNPTDVYPCMDAVAGLDSRSWFSHAWEASLFYSPAAFAATIQSDAARYPVRWGVHLQQGYPHFGPDLGPDKTVESAREFWLPAIAAGVKTLLYQYTYLDTGGMQQARANDVSVRLINGGTWNLPETVDWVAFEIIAQAQFNNEKTGDGRVADEDMGDLRGYQALCTPGPLAPMGFGNGGRYPDGRII